MSPIEQLNGDVSSVLLQRIELFGGMAGRFFEKSQSIDGAMQRRSE